MDKLLSGRRVLVVEDEMLILMMIEDMLADLGCEAVSTAATVDHALSLVGSQDFDAAMLDMNLSGSKCYAVADALAARSVPYFFSTGNSAGEMDDGYRDQEVLRKPFRNKDLVDVLTRVLAN